jgi:hypothetical protein
LNRISKICGTLVDNFVRNQARKALKRLLGLVARVIPRFASNRSKSIKSRTYSGLVKIPSCTAKQLVAYKTDARFWG